jgi:hypothetical protein
MRLDASMHVMARLHLPILRPRSLVIAEPIILDYNNPTKYSFEEPCPKCAIDKLLY